MRRPTVAETLHLASRDSRGANYVSDKGSPDMAIATRRLTIAALLLAVLLPAAAAEPLAIYVAPEGNDAWSGRLAERNPAGTDGPLATIGRAQQVVRQLRAAGKTPQPINVLLRGVHRLAAPVVFTPEDSGSEQAPITYAAPSGQRPVLSGGRIITGWKKGPGEVWTVELPEVRAGTWYFATVCRSARACRGSAPTRFLRVQGLVDEARPLEPGRGPVPLPARRSQGVE